MECPRSFGWIDYGKDDKGFASHPCLEEKCAWWDDSDDHCCIIDIASSLSMVVFFLKDITENGIPKRGG